MYFQSLDWISRIYYKKYSYIKNIFSCKYKVIKIKLIFKIIKMSIL